MHTIDQTHISPTLPNLLALIVSMGMDRGSFVRAPRPNRTGAICVCMLSPAAIRDVGLILKDHAAKLPDHPQHHLSLDLSTPIEKIFEVMGALDMEWGWHHIRIDTTDGLLFFVLGPSVTPGFAAALTQCGVPTSLD